MEIVERSLQRIGKSLLISLPKEWTKTLKLNKGEKVKIMVSEQGHLMIAPEFVKEKGKKEAVIQFDEHFNRRFFREYFEGNSKITIKITKLTETKRKELYNFLKKFMNVQIIEESENEIAVKCFRIDELSIEECLKRMYFLSIGLFEEIAEDSKMLKIKELREAMTRFYYMLVMQIRIFLSEGRFIGNDKISLLRAMDIRMVAEKIQRVGEILEIIGSWKKNSLLEEVKDYYSKAFNFFILENFEKALPLWKKEKEMRKKYERLQKETASKKDIVVYPKINNIARIARYAREISMLVR